MFSNCVLHMQFVLAERAKLIFKSGAGKMFWSCTHVFGLACADCSRQSWWKKAGQSPSENPHQSTLEWDQKSELMQNDKKITGFNIGVNDGKDSGQTVMHCHIHLIPRRKGDMKDPRGGVRGVIPEKQSY